MTKQATPQEPASEAPTRPYAIVVLSSQQVTSVVVSTSTPLDCIGLPMSRAPFADWPDIGLNVARNVNVNVVITPSDSQLVAAEWSSRFELPVPLREDTVELRQRPSPVRREIVLPSGTHDSSDDDDVVDEEQYNWHVLDSAMRK